MPLGCVGIQNVLHGFVVLSDELGVPDHRRDVPLDGAGESVFPVGPQQPLVRHHQIAHVGIAVKGLQRAGGEDLQRALQMPVQQGDGFRREGLLHRGLFENGQTFLQNRQGGEVCGERS